MAIPAAYAATVEEIEAALRRAEEAVQQGRRLGGTGFWKAVARARRDPELARTYAQRIGKIDALAFTAAVRLKVPIALGNLLLLGGLAAGLVAMAWAARLESPIREILFLAGFAAVLVSSHSPTHYLIGRAFGMRFTHYFLGGPPPPRPGVKSDYSTYLLVDAKKRAIMHASGAVVSKILPFAAIPAALVSGVADWTVWVLIALGIVQVMTDIVFSTKTSDWKKAIREWRAAS